MSILNNQTKLAKIESQSIFRTTIRNQTAKREKFSSRQPNKKKEAPYVEKKKRQTKKKNAQVNQQTKLGDGVPKRY